MSHRSLAWALALLFASALSVRSHANAQACHSVPLRESAGTSYRVSLSGQAATYRNASYAGEYRGLTAFAAVSERWFYAAAMLPAYHLVRNGQAEDGLGDVAVDVRVPLVRTDDDALRFGLELAGTLPTGQAEVGLGMGHVMLMPGPFLAFTQGKVSWIAQLAYGRALSGHDSGMHSHKGPIVNPMNRSEIEHALSLRYAFHTAFHATARAYGAVPIGDDPGSSREVLGFGLIGITGPLDTSIEVQVPVVGAPFSAKTLLTVGAEW